MTKGDFSVSQHKKQVINTLALVLKDVENTSFDEIISKMTTNGELANMLGLESQPMNNWLTRFSKDIIKGKYGQYALIHAKIGQFTYYGLIPKKQSKAYEDKGFTKGKHTKHCSCVDYGSSVSTKELDDLFKDI